MTRERSTILWALLFDLDQEPRTLESIRKALVQLIREELIEAGEIER